MESFIPNPHGVRQDDPSGVVATGATLGVPLMRALRMFEIYIVFMTHGMSMYAIFTYIHLHLP